MKRVLLSASILSMLLACSTNETSNYSQLQCFNPGDDFQKTGTFNCTLLMDDKADQLQKALFREKAVFVDKSTCSVSVTWNSGKIVRNSFRGRPAYDMFLWGKGSAKIQPTTFTNSEGQLIARLNGTGNMPAFRGCREALPGFN